jgi:hypothetical protein
MLVLLVQARTLRQSRWWSAAVAQQGSRKSVQCCSLRLVASWSICKVVAAQHKLLMCVLGT